MALPNLSLGVDPILLVAGALGVFLVVFIIYLVLEGDSSRAAEKTGKRARGLSLGIAGVAIAAIAEVLHLLAEFPGLVIGAIGLGAIVQGWNWDVFLAVIVLTYIVLGAVRNLAAHRRA